jgi:hypothetical protein
MNPLFRRDAVLFSLALTSAVLAGCGAPAPEASTLERKTGAVFGVDAQWWPMANVKAKDIAVGTADQIWIINTSNDVYAWKWKNGAYDFGNPAGGSWSVLPDAPGNANMLRIASSAAGVLWGVAGNSKAYRYDGGKWVATASPGAAFDVAVGVDGTPFISTGIGSHYYTYKLVGAAWVQVGPNFQQDRIALTIDNQPIVRVNVSSSFGFYGQGRYSAATNAWTLYGNVSFIEYGGVDERNLDYQTYELWVVSSPSMRLSHYDTESTGTVLQATSVTAQQVGASAFNQTVVRTDTSGYVQFTSDFYRS